MLKDKLLEEPRTEYSDGHHPLAFLGKKIEHLPFEACACPLERTGEKRQLFIGMDYGA